MELRLDLHIHSERSFDGCMSLDEIVRLARERGLNGVAICDHDRVLESVPEYDDLLIIPAIEVSTERGHLLGLFVTKPIETRQFSEAVTAIHTQGGLAVIAHPFEHSTDANRLDDVMSRLDGVEMWNSRADRKNRAANAMALALAKKWDKPVTAGSDAHVPEEVGGGVTVLEAEELSIPAVKAALLRGAKQVEGRRGRAMCVARSQKTKREKTNAGAKKQVKGMLFTVKCALQDFTTREDVWHVIAGQDR